MDLIKSKFNCQWYGIIKATALASMEIPLMQLHFKPWCEKDYIEIILELWCNSVAELALRLELINGSNRLNEANKLGLVLQIIGINP